MRMRPLALALLVASGILALAPEPAAADSWGPPSPLLASSEDGRWYVITNPQKGWSKVDLLLVRRAEGAPRRELPPQPVSLFKPGDPLRPEAGDEVVARATGKTPMEVRCLSGGKGFVLFENFGGIGYGTSLAVYDGQAKLVFAKQLHDLFSRQRIHEFGKTVSSIWWYDGLWIDEARGEVTVVVRGPALLRVRIADGKTVRRSATDLLERIGKGPVEEQTLALDTAIAMKVDGLVDAAKRNFAAPTVPLALRLRLAVILAQHGDAVGRDVLLEASAPGVEKELREFAVKHLPIALGTGAIPRLRDILRETSSEARHAAEQAFVSLGEAAVGPLAEMLLEVEASPDYRGAAASALGWLGKTARPAVSSLVQAARAPSPEYVANAALNALVDILPPKELSPKLIALLAHGSGDDDRIALFFQNHPTRAAIPALVTALERQEQAGGGKRDWTIEALVACAGGRKVGKSAAAWRAWLARQPKRR